MGKPAGLGGEGEKHDEREGVRCKILHFRRGLLLFSFPFINWRKGGRAIKTVILFYTVNSLLEDTSKRRTPLLRRTPCVGPGRFSVILL